MNDDNRSLCELWRPQRSIVESLTSPYLPNYDRRVLDSRTFHLIRRKIILAAPPRRIMRRSRKEVASCELLSIYSKEYDLANYSNVNATYLASSSSQQTAS